MSTRTSTRMGRRRRSPVRLAAALAAATVALPALSACTTSSGTQAAGQNYQAGDGTITVVQADRRQAAGTLQGETVDGASADLAAHRGSVVVLNVWGSWCPPCQHEAPALQAAYTTLKAKGVTFLGINVRENGNRDLAAAFERNYGITYPSLFDAGDKLLALRGIVPPNAIPSTVVVDAQGRIAARISGPTTTATLVDIVDDVIAGRVRAS